MSGETGEEETKGSDSPSEKERDQISLGVERPDLPPEINSTMDTEKTLKP
jgi:hypothetical protein